jgi:hypothetical protein
MANARQRILRSSLTIHENLSETIMFGYKPKRTVVFFVAKSHADLSWYLSFNASSPAANDQRVERRESGKRAVSGVAAKRGLLLHLVISQPE